ncbi:MAG: FAD-dependent oxidoreductase [Clostridia bacterium]|nr:FAD-dependent oxidoreductase [Clostridia bacterium]
MCEFEKEINRCLNCNNKPCKNACPLENDIPRIISLIKQGNCKDAYEVLSETTVLPAICSIICPHEKQCRKNCTLKYKGEALSVGVIESNLAKMAVEKDWKLPMFDNSLKGKKVAIVGAGPAGLTAAAFLARYGAEVSIFEKREKLGGVLMYGIPDFRLDKTLLENTINRLIEELNIKVFCNYKFNDNLNYDDLLNKYDAIFLGMGANKSKMLNISGEKLKGVFGGNELLEYDFHPDYNNKVVFVSGGGNVAIDTARIIKRKGAKRTVIVYRRSEEEMPADLKEIADAKKDGVEFIFNTNVINIIGKEKVEKIECIKTKYDENEKLVNVKDTNYFLDADYFVMSIGSTVDESCVIDNKIELNKNGKVLVNDDMQIGNSKFFAGGNIISDNSSAAMAARSGRDAAYKIRDFLLE